MTKYQVKIYSLVLGISSLSVQFLLIRICLSNFYGIEPVVGIIFAFWLIWVGLGSFFSKRVKKACPIPVLFILSLLCAFIVLVLLTSVRPFLNLEFGEMLSLPEMSILMAVLLSLPCFLFGLLYARLSVQADIIRVTGKAAAFVYAFESMGSVLGGVVVTFF